jgi:transmembrane sensor
VDQQLIINLFQKYLRNECSPEEVDQLLDWLANPSHQDGQRELIRQELTAGMMKEPSEVEPASFPKEWDRRLVAIFERVDARRAQPAIRYRLGWLRVAAAAVVGILLAGSVLWVVYHNPDRSPALVQHFRKDAMPGGERALLTLADGQKITLDSAASGQIAQQGNTSVQKSSTGQLTYNMLKANPTATLYNTLTTPRGGQYQLRLPDGSHVWLNAASSITYPVSFPTKDREVTITGEAYFEIAKDKSRPFHVKANGMEVQVLGTTFNINVYADEPQQQTTLLEGSVRVDVAGAQSLVGVNTNKNKPSVVLKPGQQVQLIVGENANNGNKPFKVVTDADIEETLAWKNGEFVFNRLDMAAILRQVSRWYDLDIVNPAQPVHRTFSGIVSRNSNLSEVMKILEQAGIRFRIEGKKLILL